MYTAEELQAALALIQERVQEDERASMRAKYPILNQELREFDLQSRTVRCLVFDCKAETVGDVIERFTEKELMDVRDFGAGCLKDLRTKLAEHGLRIREDRVGLAELVRELRPKAPQRWVFDWEYTVRPERDVYDIIKLIVTYKSMYAEVVSRMRELMPEIEDPVQYLAERGFHAPE